MENFPRYVKVYEIIELFHLVATEEFFKSTISFQRDKSLGLDTWRMEFYVYLFDIVGNDFLKLLE